MSEPLRINSRDNQHLKFVRSVRDGREDGYISIEGSRLSLEALESGLTIQSCFCTELFMAAENWSEYVSAFETDSPVFLLSEPLLKSIAETKSPQGILIIARRPKDPELSKLLLRSPAKTELPLWIFLDQVNNPSNLGAVIRTAEAAGAIGMIVSKNSADPFSPKALRASMGSAFRLPIVTNIEYGQLVQTALQAAVEIVAIDTAGEKNYLEHNWKESTILAFGSEASGLSEEIRSAAVESIRIEMNRNVESLNLAVSCGVVLFEARRLNRK